jgi:hypothetical protein
MQIPGLLGMTQKYQDPPSPEIQKYQVLHAPVPRKTISGRQAVTDAEVTKSRYLASSSLTLRVDQFPSHPTKQVASEDAQNGNARLVLSKTGPTPSSLGKPSGFKLEARNVNKA